MKDLKLSIIVLSAPLALLFAISQLWADYALYRHVRDFGLPATATVHSIELASFIARPEGGRMLTYTLDLPGRARINGTAHMSHAAATRYTPGQEIGIVYAATDPRLTALSVSHAWSALVSHLMLFIAYAAALALAFALLRASRHKSWRSQRAAAR